MDWGLPMTAFRVRGSKRRGTHSHMETYKIKWNTGGENTFVLSAFSFLISVFFILGDGDRQRAYNISRHASRKKNEDASVLHLMLTLPPFVVFVLFSLFSKVVVKCAIVCFQSLLCN